MQFKKSLMTATLLTIGGFTAMSSANAANPTTSSFGVSMEVESICTVNAAPTSIVLAKTAAGKATEAVTAITELTLNCSKGSIATIGLTPVSTTSTDGTGNLKGGVSDEELVAYKLTSGSASGTAWGTATTVSTAAFADYATAITTPIYLTVTSNADVTPGTYSDTVNISVTY